jgi:hypothetical protein
MSKICFSLVCFWLVLSLSAQTIQSTVIDFNTRAPIPFVNIGILGKNHGTVSDDAGKFSLEVPKAGWSSSDTLRFSAIGYQSVDVVLLHEPELPPSIYLKPITLTLPTVVINPKKFKRPKVLGHRNNSPNMVFYFQSNRLGTELCNLIEVKKGSFYLKKAHFNIAQNNFGSLFFRVHVYENDGGKPGKNLLPKELIVSTDFKKGTLSVDLAPYNLVVNQDFFLGLEWVKTLNKGNISKDLQFCIGLGQAGGIFAKNTSQALWHTINQRVMGFQAHLGFYVEGAQE